MVPPAATSWGQPLLDVAPELAELVRQAIDNGQRLTQGQVTLSRKGRERNLSVRVASEQTAEAEHGYVVTLDDITELVSAQRTSARADVARRIAHEIKNPLTPIQLSAERLRRKYGKVITEDRAIFEQCTDTIVRQVDDIRRMVDEFSRFARMPKPVMEREDVADTVRQAVFLMRVGHPDIDLELSMLEDPMSARFDRRLVSQALTNIIKNGTEAIAALPEGSPKGRIEVTATRDGDLVNIDVVDNGIGLPKEHRSRLLEPYVTTREKGTGLGLAIVGKILEDHGGGIELHDAAEKEPGRNGAWIRLRFAVNPPQASGTGSYEDKQIKAYKQCGDMTAEILIVDDEPDICELVAGILQDEGYTTRTARDADSAINAIKARRPNLVFLDIWLQGSKLDGLQLLDAAKREYPDLPVVMISGHGNIETAVAAIKQGAYDFIEKPFKADRLILVADRALENSRLKREVKELKAISPQPVALVGKSPAINQLRQTIEKVAPTNSRIMIIGTSGSGKELCARTLHNLSTRANGPFVVINAAAITPESMEVELFGIEQSNGSQSRKAGALEEAHGGTLFIDEIADMPRETQNKILRVLVDQTFHRVGGNSKVTVDVRIISSTARNLEAEIAAGNFREDLYHRLSVVPIRRAAAGRTAGGYSVAGRLFHGPDFACHRSAEANHGRGRDGACCNRTDWPGNVRQLRNNVERADDPCRRRSECGDQFQHAAAGCRLDGTVDAERQWRRAVDEPAAA